MAEQLCSNSVLNELWLGRLTVSMVRFYMVAILIFMSVGCAGQEGFYLTEEQARHIEDVIKRKDREFFLLRQAVAEECIKHNADSQKGHTGRISSP